jgi:hypothetical protein
MNQSEPPPRVSHLIWPTLGDIWCMDLPLRHFPVLLVLWKPVVGLVVRHVLGSSASQSLRIEFGSDLSSIFSPCVNTVIWLRSGINSLCE